ncbi:PTS glucitol/sorbitol transporter subunit IIA [Maledivibacter halophilus]|uniref:PTS system, glucitol/sorbitol-specific IIA component n=1 Tax=Maledivibacter halophilus TaxID=36842 RepID=A0A1T5LBR9_9FIRM|nr:PTS glucitol/sorbitol transporter subunit IIA [Maledivibacter halophilus]SKC73135.1 PTS system, glucitol/sorbitol-specific IIA component [Maledivibacter halophilus]
MEEYKSKIIELGTSVDEMSQLGMLILFSNDAPSELRDYCIIHDNKQLLRDLKVNQKIYLGKDQYTISAIGNTALQQWQELGHVTLRFDGELTPQLPGTVHLNNKLKGIPKIGEFIKVEQEKS